MTKDKYDFIDEFLSNHKLSSVQHERILLLTTTEIKKDQALGNVLDVRVKKLEKKLGLNKITDTIAIAQDEIIQNENIEQYSDNKLKNDVQSNTTLPKYYPPFKLYKFLFEYNQNRILKSTCHEIDADTLTDILDFCGTDTYSFEKHLDKITSAFEEHDKKYFCPSSTKALIRGYITGKDFQKNELENGWSSDKIKINWANYELHKWATKNKIPPNSTQEILKNNKTRGFDFDGFTSNLFVRRIQTFKELVLHFKSLFHIRADNSLKFLLCKTNEAKQFADRIDFKFDEASFPDNIEIFTDVDKLIQGYVRIIELIETQHKGELKPVIRLSFYETDSTVSLSIHHLNNIYNKSIQNTIERMGQTYTNLINKQLNGLCNLLLRADFGHDGMAEINLWNGKEIKVKRNGLEKFEGGVEHIFEFCKILTR